MINILNDELLKDKELIQCFEKIFNECMKQTNQKYKKLICSLEFVNEEEIHKLNVSQRNVDKPTDVLSFPMLGVKVGEIIDEKNYPFDLDENGELSVGDIVICSKIAEEQAKEYCHSVKREYCYLFLHGLLHLLGYDHIEESDKKIMREKEESILSSVDKDLVID